MPVVESCFCNFSAHWDAGDDHEQLNEFYVSDSETVGSGANTSSVRTMWICRCSHMANPLQKMSHGYEPNNLNPLWIHQGAGL